MVISNRSEVLTGDHGGNGGVCRIMLADEWEELLHLQAGQHAWVEFIWFRGVTEIRIAHVPRCYDEELETERGGWNIDVQICTLAGN
ncbi:hypothetical protein E3N88_02622 [Mikania micrantha]|uniref:Uncharacterized protein n=1 Tax=Mikania micrantha TaxID=192012 RepID=A0A5N6Q625_9ASTR|nr:hypothetical protein E3N88_02622 [Mikania micrantha]